MDAILIQLRSELKKFNTAKGDIETLFIGGGTPSTIAPDLYKPFFDILQPYMSKDIEITTEANPNSATKEWLTGMRKLGVTRVSFGVQSFNEKKLKLLGRNHTPLMAKEAIENAKDIGFKNISLDLIYATAIDTKKVLKDDLDTALSLPINHLSAYSLTIEENTPFFKKPEIQNDDEDMAYWFIKEIPLPQYEISNFGSYRSKHNLGYWQYKDYIGIGCGAVGFLKDRRFYTKNTLEEYIKNPNYTDIEELDTKSIKSEKILLGLRSIVGFSKELLTKEEMQRALYLVDDKKLNLKNGRFYNFNYLLSDEMTLYIID